VGFGKKNSKLKKNKKKTQPSSKEKNVLGGRDKTDVEETIPGVWPAFLAVARFVLDIALLLHRFERAVTCLVIVLHRKPALQRVKRLEPQRTPDKNRSERLAQAI
jgi:hypothetical protein